MWPFSRRPRELVIVLRIEGLDALTSALTANADARVKSAKIAAGQIRPKTPPAPPNAPVPEHEVRFVAWLEMQGYGEIERGHVRACYDIATGRRKPRDGMTFGAAVTELKKRGAPLPTA